MSENHPRSGVGAFGAGLAAGLGLVLASGLIVALADLIHAGGGGLALIGVWALIALPLALFVGVTLGAGNVTWGPGWVRGVFGKLREDAELDKLVAGVLVAAVIVGGVMAFGVSKLAMKLVANVNRKEVGALLLGVIVVGLVPVFALATIPVYRVTRPIAGIVPAIGPLSRVVTLIIGAIVAGSAAGLFIVFKRLDYQVLNLGQYIAPAMVLVLAAVFGLVFYGPLAGVRERIGSRGIIAGVAAVAALVLIVIGLRQPSDAARLAVTEKSYVGPLVIPALRGFFDGDGDGVSAFFGGEDCDDSRADVNPKAREIAGDGIDNNCVGGDSKIEKENPQPGDAAVPTVSTTTGGKNVLVIFVDTLRADRMGYMGYRRDDKSLTPRLDALAKESVVFKNAYAQAPNTPRSVPSFMASRYPSELAVDRDTRDYPTVKDDGNDFLFEAMKGAGWKTIGMTSHFYFCASLKPAEGRRDPSICPGVADYLNSNVLQGADEWDNEGAVGIAPSNKDFAGPRTVKKTIAKLEELAKAPDGKFAMMVHLFEPHSTYMEHDGFPITERGTAALSQKYDYEIAVTDRYIGELLDALDKTGLAKTTTVVVMSDHGEAFGVHSFAGQSMFFHGQTLYRELIHVPLLFRIPAAPGVSARMVDDVVQLIDLAPTIAALFGVKPPASWQGRSLVPAFEGKPLDPKPAFAELLPADAWKHNARSMISADGKRHVFYVISDKRWEIFDLEADPLEKKNIFDSEPTKQALQDQLAAWLDRPRDAP
jgi:arylsulfatase A-like enzyme